MTDAKNQPVEFVHKWHEQNATKQLADMEPITPEAGPYLVRTHVEDGALAEIDWSAVKLWRGRVIVRPVAHDLGNRLIHIPETFVDDPRKDARARGGGVSIGRGVVVAMGAPAKRKGKEVPPGFKVGDEVLYVGQHHSRDLPGGYHYVSQEEVQCVIES